MLPSVRLLLMITDHRNVELLEDMLRLVSWDYYFCIACPS